MPTRLTTSDGVILEIGRVDRRLLDDVVLTMERPQPPTREIQVWDGSTEEIQILNDPDYLDQLALYYFELTQQQFQIVETAVSIIEKPQIDAENDELEALYAIGLIDNENALERILGHRDDATAVVETLFFNSTVTARGIELANKKFNATWENLPISSYRFKKDFPVETSQYYMDRLAAVRYGFKWSEFCELWGWEQSEYVALYAIETAMEYMKTKQMEAKR